MKDIIFDIKRDEEKQQQLKEKEKIYSYILVLNAKWMSLRANRLCLF